MLTPLLIGTASLAGRRWGHAISGWLVGIPFTSGPITLFLYLDHGATFATIAWALAYVALARRGLGLLPGVLVGLAFFAMVGTAVRELIVGPLPLYLALALVLLVTIRLVPPSAVHDAVELPWWDLPARMFLATEIGRASCRERV